MFSAPKPLFLQSPNHFSNSNTNTASSLMKVLARRRSSLAGFASVNSQLVSLPCLMKPSGRIPELEEVEDVEVVGFLCHPP